MIGTYTSAILYYKGEFFNEVEAVWSMLSSNVPLNAKHTIERGAPVFNKDIRLSYTVSQAKTVITRYDLGAEWYFDNGWRRGRLVEIYEDNYDESAAPPIEVARYSDLKKL